VIRGVHMAESVFEGRNFVSGICKLKPKNVNRKTYISVKN